MKALVVSFVLFVAVIFGIFIVAQQYLLAIAWLCFAGLNTVVLRKLFLAPSYFEKMIMEFLDREDKPVRRDDLFKHFQAETPNLKSDESSAIFARTLARLKQRGLIRIGEDAIHRHVKKV